MRPHCLTIPGRFWDSHIYRGRLYLLHTDGTGEVLDWDRAIAGITTNRDTNIAKVAAFARSDYLYSASFSPLLSDRDFRRLLERKFQKLSEWDLVMSKKTRRKARIGIAPIRFPFPYADAVIYANVLYVAADDGIYAATVGKRLRHGISSRPEKLWDCAGYALAASWGCIALAAGDEGLFEHNIYGYPPPFFSDPSKPVVPWHTSWCSYAFQSLYASSVLGGGGLADYSRPENASLERPFKPRALEVAVPARELFGIKGEVSWGHQDKLCQVRNSDIEVMRYAPWEEDSPRVAPLGTLELEAWKGSVVSGGVATFGIVFETENAIVVVPSKGNTVTLPGEALRWRVFPRSIRYENQLHVIYEDRLEIWSFNQDYFVDQETKVAGIKLPSTSTSSSRRPSATPSY
jgi:hypothetical protein